MGADTGAERCAFRHPWLPTRCALCLQPSVSVPQAPSGSIPARLRRLWLAKRTVPLLLGFPHATHPCTCGFPCDCVRCKLVPRGFQPAAPQTFATWQARCPTHHATLHMWFPAQLRAMQAGSARFPARRAPGPTVYRVPRPPAPAAPVWRTPPTLVTFSARPFRAARRTGRRRPRERARRQRIQWLPPPGCSPRRRPGQSHRRCRG